MNYLIYLILITTAVTVFFVVSYNKFTRLKNIVLESKKQIDVQLQRRGELIPSLVETVKGYANHERQTLSEIATARNILSNSRESINTRINANDSANSVLDRLFAVSENYPQLKASTNFLELQQELQNTQNKISFSQQHYNSVVKEFNMQLERIPYCFIGSLCRFEKFDYIDIPEGIKVNPKISFQS